MHDCQRYHEQMHGYAALGGFHQALITQSPGPCGDINIKNSSKIIVFAARISANKLAKYGQRLSSASAYDGRTRQARF